MQKPLQWDGVSKGSVLGNRIFVWLIAHGGLFPAYCLLVPVSLFYALFDAQSVRALRFYWTHLGKKTGVLRLWRHFYSFGMSLIDRSTFLLNKNSAFIVSAGNEELIATALSQKKGAILLSAHVGNWELAGNMLFDRLETPINFTMVDAEKKSIREVFDKVLAQRRVAVIPIGQDVMAFVMAVHGALRKGEIVCMHGDRMLGNNGITMPFFGKTVEFPTGPFAIAALTGAPVIPIFTAKKGLRTYTIKAAQPIFVAGDAQTDRNAAIAQALGTFVKLLEEAVKENPYEWFNFYDFWQEG